MLAVRLLNHDFAHVDADAILRRNARSLEQRPQLGLKGQGNFDRVGSHGEDRKEGAPADSTSLALGNLVRKVRISW